MTNFDIEKEKVIDNLKALLIKFDEISNKYTIDLEELKQKVSNAIDSVTNQKFSIAFFGAFSDGKSTILASIINKLDIKISPEPTTDKVVSYRWGNFEIIDTPGLFSEYQLHDQLTKKYISQADLILYTVDPVNPLKNSHADVVKWIFNDIKKADSTIFIVNKMDEIADLENDDDFERNAEIKKTVVVNTLLEYGITFHKNRIICVAADPFEKKLDYWKSRETEYLKLSRMKNLETEINRFAEKYRDKLIVLSGKSVIIDSINTLMVDLNRIYDAFSKQTALLGNQIKEFQDKIAILKGDINRAKNNIIEEITILRENIFSDINVCNTRDELSNIIQLQVGNEGYIIQEKIDSILRKHTEPLITESKNLFRDIEDSGNFHANLQTKIGANLSEVGKKPLAIIFSAPDREIANAVLKIKKISKLPFKFKPWGAVKFAKGLKVIPILIEVLDTSFKVIDKIKLEKHRNDLKNELDEAFKHIIENMKKENFTSNYFPELNDFEEILEELRVSKNYYTTKMREAAEIKTELEKIKAM
ncbi:MAG: LeoA/HP0731 family dynamin-like GTPase [Bacteroidales bacterium]